MNKLKVWCAGSMAAIAVLAALVVLTAGTRAFGQDGPSSPGTGNGEQTEEGSRMLPEKAEAALFYSIAITVGVGCLSAGYAVGKVGAAALGAASEKPEIMGRALIFVGLAEGIAIYGLIIGIMLIMIL